MTAPVVGIVGGGGWLGRAIAARALARGVLAEDSLIISSRSPRGEALRDWPGIAWTQDNRELARRADVIVLSVRPQQFPDLRIDAGPALVVSVMAGVAMATLQARLGTDRIIRTMPNAAAEIGFSFTPWLAGAGATEHDREFVQALLLSCGEADQVRTEAEIDYLTGLSGSGPAFPALLAGAMLEHAAKRGLPPDVARRAVLGVVCGASRLLAEGAASPEEMVRTFIDYRGTTAAGLNEMLAKGFSEAVGAGLDAAAGRAEAMAAESERAVATPPRPRPG